MSRVALSARFDKKGLQIGSGTQLRTNAPSPQKREDANPLKNCNVLAEREGFEPSVRLPVQRFSRPSHSTTLAPLPRG